MCKLCISEYFRAMNYTKVVDIYTVSYKIRHMNSPQDMVRALVAQGFSQTRIAAGSGVTQPTISRANAGHGVSYGNGKRIEAFFACVQAGAGNDSTDNQRE